MPKCSISFRHNHREIMNNIEIGCQVQLAQFEQYIFTVTQRHADGSFTVETELDTTQKLVYQHVAQEMLKII